MERDHHQTSTRPQPFRDASEKGIEPFELTIDPNPDRLKRPRRRVDPRIALARDRSPYHVRQPARRLDAACAPRLDDRSRYPAREPLFAELDDQLGQRPLVDL